LRLEKTRRICDLSKVVRLETGESLQVFDPSNVIRLETGEGLQVFDPSNVIRYPGTRTTSGPVVHHSRT
jgi:hypothetical protein